MKTAVDLYNYSCNSCIGKNCAVYGKTFICCEMHFLAEDMILRGEY